MTTIAHNYSDLQAINYGREPENIPPKKNNYKRNFEQKPFTQTVTATFVMIQRIDPIAACLWYTMISLPEVWHYRIPDLAKRLNICETTCKAKMNILIKLGVVYRYRNPDSTTEYEVFQVPQHNIPELQGRSKPLTAATYYKRNKKNTNNIDNNLVSPKSVPSSDVVVDTKNNSENKKNHDTSPTDRIDSDHSFPVDTKQNPSDNQQVDINPTKQSIHQDALTKTENVTTDSPPGPTFPGGTAIDAVISRIQPEHRQKIPIPLLSAQTERYSIDQLADICIYAIDKTSAGNRNSEHHRRRIEGYCRVLFNKHVTVPAQKDYTTYQNRDTIPLSVPVQTDYDYRKKWDEHHTRVKKVTEACIKETPEIENIKEKTDTYENAFDTVDMGSLIDRLKERKPDIDPKFKSRRKYLDRIGRPDLRGV